MTNESTPNYYEMSDEDIINMNPPAAPVNEEPVVEVEEPDQVEEAPVEPAETDTPNQEEEGGEEAAAAAPDAPNPLSDADDAIPAPEAPKEPKAPAAQNQEDGKEVEVPVKDEPAKEKEKESAGPTQEDLQGFWDLILGQPVKANGKDLQLKSPEEAKQLIQMGANYTKKMHALQPRLRVVTMLENNGLLDEAKLAHLIDISKGDKGAIQKLLADSEFDPMTADADQAASYKPGNHQVSDTEMRFNAALDDLESTETGPELIMEVAKQWDEQSRQAVYKEPSLLRAINEQKGNGLYARISEEMDRLRTLGHLTADIPFLQAYKAVGDMLNDQGRLVPEAAKQQAPQVPVATRVAAPAPQVTNSDKARAAAPPKATPASAKQEQNLLELPDDEFLKQMEGRL